MNTYAPPQQIANPLQSGKNKSLGLISLIAAFFVLIFFTKGMYENMQSYALNYDEKYQIAQEKLQELNKLNELKTKLSQAQSEEMLNINAFAAEVNEQNLIDYFYEYAQKINAGNERFIISNVTISEETMSDTGFQMRNIGISAVFSSEKTLFDFMEYVTWNSAEYKMYLSDFTYEMNNVTWNIQVSLPFAIYYNN